MIYTGNCKRTNQIKKPSVRCGENLFERANLNGAARSRRKERIFNLEQIKLAEPINEHILHVTFVEEPTRKSPSEYSRKVSPSKYSAF